MKKTNYRVLQIAARKFVVIQTAGAKTRYFGRTWTAVRADAEVFRSHRSAKDIVDAIQWDLTMQTRLSEAQSF